MIYRIEHPISLTGPYKTHGAKLNLEYFTQKWQPSIAEDYKLNYFNWNKKYKNEYYIFGFPTIKAITNWFSKGDLICLKKMGFVINCYSKKPVRKSPYQVIFIRGKKQKTLNWNKVLK